MKHIISLFFVMTSIFAMSAKVTETSWSNLSNILQENHNEIVVVDIYATWCAPCKEYSPIFAQVSEQYPKVKFYRMDIDKNMDITEFLSIESVPTTIIFYFQNGEKQPRVLTASGLMSQTNLSAMIKKALITVGASKLSSKNPNK